MKIYIDLYRKISLERKMIDLTNARIRVKSMLEISSDFFFFQIQFKEKFTIYNSRTKLHLTNGKTKFYRSI